MPSLAFLPAIQVIVSSAPPYPIGHLRCRTQRDFRMTLEIFSLIIAFRRKGQTGFGKVQFHRDSLGDLGCNLPVMCDTRARSRWLVAIKDRTL